MKRLVRLVLLVGIVFFAVEGGEYGTSDLLSQRAKKRALRAAIDSLERAIDTLGRYQRRLQTDASLQERIAREEFGMVRGDKEILYRFAEPAPDDSARAARRTKKP